MDNKKPGQLDRRQFLQSAGTGLAGLHGIPPKNGNIIRPLLCMAKDDLYDYLVENRLAWRLELVDNLAFGADGVDTMNNVAFTAGMDLRLGARPSSYWPWRSSRRIW